MSVGIELALLSQVTCRGQEITGPRQRGLFALLAADLRPGCAASRLIAELWPDTPPANPSKALQVLVSRARSQWGPDLIASTPTGYRLTLRPDEVDAALVTTRAAEAERLLRSGDSVAALATAELGLSLWADDDGDASAAMGIHDPTAALTTAERALSLWADDDATPNPAPAAFEAHDPLARLRAERESTRWRLRRVRGLGLAKLGRHGEAAAPLAVLAAGAPRDEVVLAELLRCETATVGAPTALERYESYRLQLREELGTDPGPELRAVHRELLRQTAPPARHGIPHEPNPLLGRDGDMSTVAELLRVSRVVSIVGAGGLGKTRLAYAVSRATTHRTVHAIALAGLAPGGDVTGEVAASLAIGDAWTTAAPQRGVPTDPLARIVHVLGPDPALLVLDNCEHVLDGVAALVRDLVAATPNVQVLTTSRAPLGLSSESVHPLPELDPRATEELFRQRAHAVRPTAALPAEQVAELCRHLDGLPLAVELAAARVRIMPVAEIHRRLADRFALLSGGSRDAPSRHHDLTSVVDWSWNLLDAAGQAAMRALSVYPDGFTADAARISGVDEDVLANLVDQSLLKVTDTPTGVRFRMLEMVREFSTAKREAATETAAAMDRLCRWAREFAASHRGQALSMSDMEIRREEHDNLVATLRYALRRGDEATAAAAFAMVAGLWFVESNYGEAKLHLIREVSWQLSHYRPEPSTIDMVRTALTVCAVTSLLQGPGELRSLVTLRRLPTAAPDGLLDAVATVLIALPDSRTDHRRLNRLCDDADPLLAGIANLALSYLCQLAGDNAKALRAAQRMLDHPGVISPPWLGIPARMRVAELLLLNEQGGPARQRLLEARRLAHETDLSLDSDSHHLALALASLQCGDTDEAERWTDEIASRSSHSGWELAFIPVARAEIQLARGSVDEGLRLWREGARQAATPARLGEPWALETQAAAVVAHARHRRLDAVTEVASELSSQLERLLTDRTPPANSTIVEFPVIGALALALAQMAIVRGATSLAAQLTALSEAFGCARQFNITMSSTLARTDAEAADAKAYRAARARYAVPQGELRRLALEALRDWRFSVRYGNRMSPYAAKDGVATLDS